MKQNDKNSLQHNSTLLQTIYVTIEIII
jgi:hypothetical protein